MRKQIGNLDVGHQQPSPEGLDAMSGIRETNTLTSLFASLAASCGMLSETNVLET